MAGLSLIRKWVTKQLTKPNAEGIMKIPGKGNIDFGEMLVKEKLFTSGIDEKLIQSEKQLERILDSIEAQRKQTLKRDFDEHVGTTRTGEKNYLYTRKEKPKKSGEVIKVDFDKGRWNKASGGKAKESWTDKLVRWGGGPSVLAGELGLEGINQIYQLLNMPGLYNQGGRAGLSYLLAEDTNERVPYVFGGRTIGVLKNLLSKMKKSHGIPRGEKTLKPDKFAKNLMSEEDKLKLLQFETQYANSVLEHLKADRQLFKQLEANKAMKDEGLDFLMKNLVETQAPHMKNYKSLADIDQAILELETLVKNKTLKEGRQLNADGGRIGLAAGGGLPPISGNVNLSFKTHKGSDFPIPGLTISEGGYSGNVGGNINFPVGQGNVGLEGILGFGRNKYNVDYQGQNVASGVGETKLGDVWNIGAEYNRPLWGGTIGISGSLDQSSNKQGNILWRKKFAGGGMGRRAFLKLMAALGATGVAAKSGLAGLFKGGAKKKIAKELTQVPIKNIDGMPAWFKPLVNKVIKEGTEIPSGAERVIVHKTKLPDSKTDVYVNQDLSTGNVWVDIGAEKHGFADGKYGQPVRLEYKAKEIIEPDMDDAGKVKAKGKEVPEEFNVEEAEFTGGHPENVKFEETTIEKFGDHGSDFREVEKFAIGKNTIKGQIGGKSKPRPMNQKDIDYASGGLARMLGE